jgi:hypothetical protein
MHGDNGNGMGWCQYNLLCFTKYSLGEMPRPKIISVSHHPAWVPYADARGPLCQEVSSVGGNTAVTWAFFIIIFADAQE